MMYVQQSEQTAAIHIKGKKKTEILFSAFYVRKLLGDWVDM